MKNLYNKVNIKNFGAKKIYVISKSGEHQRKSDFIKAWESFDGFEYEFVDAIMSDDIDLNELFLENKISDKFTDHSGCLSKTVYAVALSHRKVWEKIWGDGVQNQYDDLYLILEDDVRPTKDFVDSIFDGKYKQILEYIENVNCECVFWSKRERKTHGDYINELVCKPYIKQYTIGHAYSILPTIAFGLIRESNSIDRAQDVLVEEFTEWKNTIAPWKSFIQQQGKLWNKFVMEPDDNDFIYSSSTTRNFHIHGKLDNNDLYRHIDPDILSNVLSIEKNETDEFIINLNFSKKTTI